MIIYRRGVGATATSRSEAASNGGRGGGIFSKLQNRLLFPMSILDIIYSLGLAPSTALIPRGSPCTYGAIGTQFTCTIQGVMVKLGMAVQSYNAMLCLYYYCVLQCNMHETQIERLELYMHIYAIVPTFICSLVPAIFSLYNNNIFFCSIVSRWRYEYPPEGFEVNIVAVRVGTVIKMATIFIVFLNVFIIAYCMISVYGTARRRVERIESVHFSRSSQQQQQQQRNRTTNGGGSRALGVTVDSSNELNQRGTGGRAGRIMISRRRTSSFRELTTDTKRQALIYVGGYLATWTCPIIALVFNMCEKPLPVWIRLLLGLLMPSQGIWNFLGFIRPRFKAVSNLYPQRSFFEQLSIVIFNKSYGPVDDLTVYEDFTDSIQTASLLYNEVELGSSQPVQVDATNDGMRNERIEEESSSIENDADMNIASLTTTPLQIPNTKEEIENTKKVSFPLKLESSIDDICQKDDCVEETQQHSTNHEEENESNISSNLINDNNQTTNNSDTT